MSILFEDDGRLSVLLVEELGRHGTAMRRNWSDNDADPVTVELGCLCGFVRGTVTAQEMSADLSGWLRKHYEHVAEEILLVLRVEEAGRVEDDEIAAWEEIQRGAPE